MENKRKIVYIAEIIAYVGIWVLMSLIAQNAQNFYFFELTGIEAGNLNGILTVLQTLLCIDIEMRYEKRGFITSFILIVTYTVFLICMILTKGDLSPLPGVVILLGALITIMLLRGFQKDIENKNKILNGLVYLDPLTETPNRRAIRKELNELTQGDEPFSLVFVDLDNFKTINDTSGHEAGDAVLCETAKRWKSVCGSNDIFGRIGGDEFSIIIKQSGEPENLELKLRKFQDALCESFVYKDKNFYVSASFGVANYPNDAVSVDELLRFSDIAMYQAKKFQGEHICFFVDTMKDIVEDDVRVTENLYHALEQDDFQLVFQPQFNMEDRKLRGFETLLRMKDKQGKPISPAVFIPIAEKRGIIADIDCWVMQQAMMQFMPIITKYGHRFVLSINISVAHLMTERFIKDVKDALMMVGFPPQQLEIEITESVLIESVDKAAERLNEIRKLGVRIALDDFGTGYASLSYLMKLPIDILKIDKCFIEELKADDTVELNEFVEAIISMGHKLHFQIVSEGVETEEQLEILRKMKCDFLQGYLWGKPMPLEQAEKLLE